MLEKIKSGYETPNEVIPFLLGQTIPSPILEEARKYSSKWKWDTEEGFITFTRGGFAGGTKDRPEFAARNYYELSQLQSILDDLSPPFDRSAEIGSGYGRLSPWISAYSDEHYGIEPNREQATKASKLYPDCKWVDSTIQNLNADDNYFDLIVSWTVLQHIPEERTEPAVKQIERTLSDDGHLILCEETEGEYGTNNFPRSVERYKQLFSSLTLTNTYDRQMEPTYEEGRGTVMVFKNE